MVTIRINFKDFNAHNQHSTMRFDRALLILSKYCNVICRREKWGCTSSHIYLEKGDKLLVMSGKGVISYFVPSIDDYTAEDWQVVFY